MGLRSGIQYDGSSVLLVNRNSQEVHIDNTASCEIKS